MNTLEKSKARRDRAEGGERGPVPRYGKNGTPQSRWRIIPESLGFLLILLGLAVAAVHIPVLLYKESPVSAETAFAIRPDESGVQNLLEYARDHPQDDFDSDGLSNADELTYGTDPRNPDTDADGISDYAEVYLFNTRPGDPEQELEKVVSARLEAMGSLWSDPYKIHDVVLWADDLASRSAGTVIPTLRGYRITAFSGWAQFPDSVYAYRLLDGFHIPLSYREAENAWRIDAAEEDIEVLLYSEKLTKAYMMTSFGKAYRLPDEWFTEALAALLPNEHSFLTCREIVEQDLHDLELTATATGTKLPETDFSGMSRFAECTNEFSALTAVYSSILSGPPDSGLPAVRLLGRGPLPGIRIYGVRRSPDRGSGRANRRGGRSAIHAGNDRKSSNHHRPGRNHPSAGV